jgi:hypothetical protein
MSAVLFYLSQISEANSTFQSPQNIQSTTIVKCTILLHFQHIAPLHIEVVLTSSRPTRKYFQVGLIFNYIYVRICLITINKYFSVDGQERFIDTPQIHVLY